MRIQLQNSAFAPTVGGIETYFDHVSRLLLAMGHSVTVLCEAPALWPAGFQDPPELPVFRHPPVPSLGRRGKLWLFDTLYRARVLQQWVRRNLDRTDVIIARNAHYAYASRRAAPEVPVVFVNPVPASQIMALERYGRRWRERTAERLTLWQADYIERAALHRSNRIVTLSQNVKRQIVDLYGIRAEGIRVIPPGVDQDKYRPGARDDSVLRELRIPAGVPIVICVCRLVKWKNVAMLLAAFARLMTQHAHLMIVGDGPERLTLEAMAADLRVGSRVKITGYRREVGPYLRTADVFVLPSIHEGFGHVYLEAMASGLPCIGLRSDYPRIANATEEIIVDGETGYWADPDSVERLSEMIDAILGDQALRARMGAAARRRCETHYRWEKHVDDLVRALPVGGR